MYDSRVYLVGGPPMRKLVSLFVIGVSIASPAVASAATVESIVGPVSLNSGNGFRPVGQPTQTKTGDLVQAGQSGSAKIVYDDGCSVLVKPGRVVRVGATSPCTAKYALGGELRRDPFLGNLGPFSLGTAAAWTAFCISSYCKNNHERNRPASP